MVAVHQSVTNEELKIAMVGMLAELKSIPRINPDQINTRLERIENQQASIENRQVSFGNQQVSFGLELSGVSQKMSELEKYQREANGCMARMRTDIVVLQDHDQSKATNWGRVWAILQGLLMIVLTLIVTGVLKP